MKKQQHSPGFTFVELTVGLFLLGVLGTMVVMAIQSTGRETDFTDNHFTGLLLSQKVVEDLNEEIWINPHGFSTLGIEGNHGLDSPITDGEAVFFTNLQDEKSPWQQIEPSEGKIDSNHLPLYDQVQNFRLGVNAKRLAPPGGGTPDENIYRGGIVFSWKGKSKPGNCITENLFFAPASAKKVATTDLISPTALAMNGSYTQFQGYSGGDPKLMQEMGKVAALSGSFVRGSFLANSLSEASSLQDKLNMGSQNLKLVYDYHQKLANLWFEVSRQSFNILYALDPSITYIMDHFSNTSLGGGLTGGNEYLYQSSFRDYRLVYESFVGALRQSRANYQSIVSGDLALQKGNRVQYLGILRLIDIYRVLTVLPSYPSGLAEYQAFLNQLGTFSEGRNPYLSRFVLQEKDFAGDAMQLAAQHPNLQEISRIFGTKFANVLGFIHTQTQYKGSGYASATASISASIPTSQHP
ncbi:MAG: prepilin-type N-terminal cleavage/methylation domain-containing protein [Candidatus Riflebacteria bacterium]|nr:prepilin-type N-terminal cleavage/methylation domain-containing protein [Candidatus Riflebacteria bacterium]